MPNIILQGYVTNTGTGGITGATRPNQVVTYFDALASVLKTAYPSMGLALNGEVGTMAAVAQAMRVTLMGDGTTTHPGLGSAQLQSKISQYIDAIVLACRYDNFFKQTCQTLVGVMDTVILQNLPPGWQFVGGTGAVAHALDAHLLRLNACNADCPTTPTDAGVLTASYNVDGALPSADTDSAPTITHTLVGTYDYQESLPAPSATVAPITGAANSYAYQIPGVVPAGVKKIRIYRTLFDDPTGTLYWCKDYATGLTTGAAYPAIPIYEPDSLLRQDWSPPSWLSCLMVPEAAALFALTYATLQTAPGAQRAPLVFDPTGMLSATNVALGPANGFIGIGNPEQSSLFGTTTLGTGFVSSTIQTENNAALNVQGFLGALAVQARITQALNGTRLPKITYTYVDEAGGFNTVKTETTHQDATTAFPDGNVGSVAVWTPPPGRLILSVTEAEASGTASSGAYVYESTAIRAY